MKRNHEIIDIEDVIQNSFRNYKPVITNICCLVCIILFIGINLDSRMDSWEAYTRWGAPNFLDIFDGKWWGLITSNFLHVQWWHILFNLYWFWLFGKKLEFEEGRIHYILITLTSAFVSSVAQLVFSNTTGIGLSGIVYAFFGFILVRSKTTDDYRGFINKQTVNMLIFWLFFCLILTWTDAMNIGNAAHFGGFLWGMFLAYIARFRKYIQWIIGVAVLAVFSSMIVWTPFSVCYLSYQAYTLHKGNRVEEAMGIYQKIIERKSNDEFAQKNLELLQVYQLGEIAFDYHEKGEYQKAREAYEKIIELDPHNDWAKRNLKSLPPLINNESENFIELK
ncbi:MAG: rhomboid family intramembrane serine protease [Bacteroides sp.]|nr:rhomboid family intramembrane serine protease [Bacteroides sp.]